MVELSSQTKNDVELTPELERFLASDRGRPKSDNNSVMVAEKHGFSVKGLMKTLQERFSHTGDISSEIEEMVEAQVQMRTRDLFRQANYDALTHLPNRTYFHSTLESLVIKAEQTNTTFALLFLDLDGFKSVNDNYGHPTGDELLRNVSARLVSAVREGDIISRLGGDEFVVLLADVADKEIVKSVNQRIIREVSRPYWINGKEVKISTSIGVANYPDDASSSTDLIERADQALYVSKNAGRGVYRFFSEIENDVSLSSYALVQMLDKAVADNQIEAVFEPQMDLASNKVVGASITAKWNEAELQGPYLVSWMNYLDSSASAESVGTWLIDSALFYLKQWLANNVEMVVSIPIVEKVWQQDDFVSFMNARLSQYGVEASQIQLEFTAKSLFQNEALKVLLDDLTTAGYQITISDIGEQSLDLSMLALINLSELKLDRDWLYESMQSERGKKWATGLIQMAKKLDLCVIATGVENEQQAATYKQMGCTMAQGMNWSSPVNPEELASNYL